MLNKSNLKFYPNTLFNYVFLIAFKRFFTLITFLLFMLNLQLLAAEIEGLVLDEVTGNPIQNASVVIKQIEKGTATNLSGKFKLIGLEERTVYVLEISHISYQTLETEVKVGEASLIFKLIPDERKLPQVVVTANRTNTAEFGGSLTNIDHKSIELNYAVQDIPLTIVGRTPGATAFSWSGSAVGAQNIRIRGFDADRLSVTVEGVPMNDPGEHIVYFQDTPDFLSSVYDIQIERGVSNLKSGPAGLGGGLNITTSDVISKPALDLTYQAGSYNTERRTLLFRSGLVEGRYNFTGRFSRVTTDGYRDHTGADLWAYFLAATRYDSKMITRFQTWGGQEEMDAYWWGIDKNTLEKNRRANYSAWDKPYQSELFGKPSVDYTGERDWFQQPHYILRNIWRLNNRLELDQSLFYIYGSGFYEQYKLNRKFSVYNLPIVVRDRDNDGIQDTIKRSDLVERKNVTKHQIGWLPRLILTAEDLKFELGLELRSFKGEHWGTVLWVKEFAGGAPPNNEWYRWRATKNFIGGFLNVENTINPSIKTNIGIQMRYINYPWERDSVGAFSDYKFNLKYKFINPRIGLSAKLDDHTKIYFSVSGAEREPNEELIFNADNPNDIPKVKKYGQSEISPERVWDFEIGANHKFASLDLSENIYAMFFKNEIVPTGNFDKNSGEPIMTNAPTSYRMGIELDATYRTPLPGLNLKGNLALAHSVLGKYLFRYCAYDADWNIVCDTTLDLTGNKIALFPEIITNMELDYSFKSLNFILQAQHIGAQYMDNREDENAKLSAYTLVNGIIRWSILKAESGKIGLDLELRGHNLMNKLYEPYGVVDVEYGTPYYIPACGRQWFGGLTIRL